MKTVLITGGAGFIGSHLITELLRKNWHVRVLDTLSAQVHGAIPEGVEWLRDTPRLEFQRGSVTSREDLQAALSGVNAVVHLASETGTGQSMYEISRYTQQNVIGTAELMQVLATEPEFNIKRVVLASSRSVYGEGAYIHPTTQERLLPATRSAEDLKAHLWDPACPKTGDKLQVAATRENDRTAPSSIYAATKLMQEDLLRITCDSLGIGATILRLQNVYGDGQSLKNPYTGILSIFSTKIRRGDVLPIFEDGMESRDFVHVSDVVNAFVAALERPEPANAIINVGSGIKTSIIEAAQALSRAFKVEPNIKITNQYRLGDIRHNYADINQLQNLLGLKPQISLDVGLGRFAKWVSTQALPEDQLEKANAELKARNMMG